MILALVGSNHSATMKAKEFLTARSFVPVDLHAINDPGVPTDRHGADEHLPRFPARDHQQSLLERGRTQEILKTGAEACQTLPILP